MEGIGGLLGLLLMIGIGVASAIEKQKKAARKPLSAGSSGSRPAGSTGRAQSAGSSAVGAEVYSAETAGYDVERSYNAETAPRRTESESITSTSATQTVDTEQVTFDPTTDFDLRRAVIEAEILTPKYF